MSSRLRGSALAALALTAFACSDGAGVTRALDTAPRACVPIETASPASSRVDLYLAEWAIDAIGALQEGTVQLRTHNDTEVAHRLALVRLGAPVNFANSKAGFLDVDNLPAEAWVGEVAAGGPGQSCTTTVDVTPGDYAVFCVVVDPGLGVRARHWSNGMVRKFHVQA